PPKGTKISVSFVPFCGFFLARFGNDCCARADQVRAGTERRACIRRMGTESRRKLQLRVRLSQPQLRGRSRYSRWSEQQYRAGWRPRPTHTFLRPAAAIRIPSDSAEGLGQATENCLDIDFARANGTGQGLAPAGMGTQRRGDL